MDLFQELNDICKKHNTTLADVYWKQAVYDYISCCSDFENEEIDDDLVQKVVDDLLNDNQTWTEIDNSIYYFINFRRNQG